MARKRQGQGETLSGSPIGQFTNFSQKPIQALREPTSGDTGYEIGQLWVDTLNSSIFSLAKVSAGNANWTRISTDSFDSVVFTASPVLQTRENTGGVPTGLTDDVNLMYIQQGIIMEEFLIGGHTIIAPRMDATGLSVALDLINTRGVEYSWGGDRVNSQHAFKVGTNNQSLFLEVEFNIGTVNGGRQFLIGLRKEESYKQLSPLYDDIATIGMENTIADNITIVDRLNAGTVFVTDTTNLWGGDGTANTLRVTMSPQGSVTYTINGKSPIITKSFKFDNNDIIVPFMNFSQGSGTSEVHLISMKVGLTQ